MLIEYCCLKNFSSYQTEEKINTRATRVRTFEVCAIARLYMFIVQVLASQLPFLANENTEPAVLPLFWQVYSIKCCDIRFPLAPGVEDALDHAIVPKNFEVPRKYFKLPFVKYFKFIGT